MGNKISFFYWDDETSSFAEPQGGPRTREQIVAVSQQFDPELGAKSPGDVLMFKEQQVSGRSTPLA
jgi:hypothetical protein